METLLDATAGNDPSDGARGLPMIGDTPVAFPGGSACRGTASALRLRFVDNLRILLISLVILHHVAVMYTGLPLWYYTEEPTGPAVGLGLTVFLLIDQAWFMGAFFLLAGYFTPGSCDRKGPRAFLCDRLIRLGIPLVAFYFVLNPLLYLGSYRGGSPLDTYRHTVGSGPLWFVLALLVLDGSYAAVRFVTGGRPARPRDPRALTCRSLAGFALVLGSVTYVWRIGIPIGSWIPGIGFPTGAYLPQYVTFFVLGTVAYRRGWFHVTGRVGGAGLGLAAGATLVFLPLALGGGLGAWTCHGTLGSLFYALWDSFFAVAAVVALPTCFAVAGPIRRLPGIRHVL